MNYPAFSSEVAAQLVPLFLTVGAGFLFLLWGAFETRVGAVVRLAALVVATALVVVVVRMWDAPAWPILGGTLLVDQFSLFFMGIVGVCALGTVVVSGGYMNRFGVGRVEYYAMIFFAASGMFVVVSAYNLISLFLGIELMSIPIYVMVAFRRRDLFANEAALKYFILGAFAIAFFLYGVSIIYGLVGTLNYKGVLIEVVDRGIVGYPPFLLAVALIFVGLAFKVAAVPFHMWVPDVYQGAPTPVTGFMAAAVKAVSFAAVIRLFYTVLMPARAHWVGVIVVLAVATMSVGNIVALVQRNIKRMLAYSSIAHAGYILVGVAALSVESTRAASAVMFYVLSYAVMTIGAFALVAAVERRDDTRGLEIDDYAGLGLRRPFLGLATAVIMFSLAGIPPTAGFFAKYYVFGAAVSKGFIALAVIGVLNSALSLYYYLRVIVVMYMRKAERETPIYDTLGIKIVLAASALVVLWLGLGPSGVLPGVDDLLSWTTQSLARVVALQ